MQQIFTKQELTNYWLPAIAAVACFVAGIYLDEKLLLILPFVILAILLFTGNLKYLFFALLVAIPLSTEFAVTDTLSTDLPDEPMMLLLAGSLVCVLLVKPSLFPVELKTSSLFFLLLLQFSWTLLTVLSSQELWLSVKYSLAKIWFILAFVVGSLMFLRTRKDVVLASKCLIFSMLLPIIVSMIRHAETGFTFESINATLSPFFRNHVNYSALLVCLFPILLVWHHFAATHLRKWILLLIGIFLTALIFAYSRGAWLCLLSGAVTWFAVKRKILLALIASAIMITALALFWLVQQDNYIKFAPDFNTTTQHTDFNEHLEATYTLKDMSTMERFYRWIAGIKMLNEKKLSGYGPNTFTIYYKEYTVTAFKTWVSENEEKSSVHNYFLLIAIEQGLPGLLLLFVVLLSMFAIAIKGYHVLQDPFERSLAMLCAVVLSMVVTLNLLSDLIETDKIGSIYFLLIGLLIRIQSKIKEQQANHPVYDR
jgi:O-antigen ligase